MAGSTDAETRFVLVLDCAEMADLCWILAAASAPGCIPLLPIDRAQWLRYRAHLAHDRATHPNRAHPCRHCRPGALYAPPKAMPIA